MNNQNTDFRNKVANMPLSDLIFIKKLGEGQFGHVFLVKGRQTKDFYALKAVSKSQIVNDSLEKHTLVGGDNSSKRRPSFR